MSRDKVREGLKLAGVTSKNITKEDVALLRKLISKHLKKSGIYRGTAKLARAKKDFKFIEMKTEQWDRREAVSFNRDGFIGFAGWADNKNIIPILDAVIEWTCFSGDT